MISITASVACAPCSTWSTWGQELEGSLASSGQATQVFALQMNIGIHVSMKVTELCFKT